jgi:hypothetical protein
LSKKTLTQKLAITVLRVWVITVIFSCAALIFGKDASAILLSVSGSLGIVLSGYFAKSYFENKEKYGNTQENQNEGGNENGFYNSNIETM